MRHNFRKLDIWLDSMIIAKKVYLFSAQLPDEEKFGLKSQMQRSGVSIASNIAEGSGRTTDKDFNRFIDIGLASSYELETQIILASELFELSSTNLIDELNSIQRKIGAFKKTLKN